MANNHRPSIREICRYAKIIHAKRGRLLGCCQGKNLPWIPLCVATLVSAEDAIPKFYNEISRMESCEKKKPAE